MTKRLFYTQPRVEIIEMTIEAGFGASETATTSPESEDSGIGAESMKIIEW